MKKAKEIFFLLVLFTFLSYLFIPFAFFSLQGQVRPFGVTNIIVSLIYLLAWISVSIYSGYRKLDTF